MFLKGKVVLNEKYVSEKSKNVYWTLCDIETGSILKLAGDVEIDIKPKQVYSMDIEVSSRLDAGRMSINILSGTFTKI